MKRVWFVMLVCLFSSNVIARPDLKTVVDYFNAVYHSSEGGWHIHKSMTGWVTADSSWGDDVFDPVTVDIQNGYLSFKPNSGDSEPKVTAALFRKTSGDTILIVSDVNVTDGKSHCAVAAYTFTTDRPVDVTASVLLPLAEKGSCYTLPRNGTTVTVTTAAHKKSELTWDKDTGRFVKSVN